jgi:hypothetical protein
MTFCKDEKDKYKGMKAAVGTNPGSGFQLCHATCVTVYLQARHDDSEAARRSFGRFAPGWAEAVFKFGG